MCSSDLFYLLLFAHTFGLRLSPLLSISLIFSLLLLSKGEYQLIISVMVQLIIVVYVFLVVPVMFFSTLMNEPN